MLLPSADFILMLDSDAFVYRLEEAAERNLQIWKMFGQEPERLMAVSHEENPKLWPEGGRFNTGVWFLRNTPKVSERASERASNSNRRCGLRDETDVHLRS